MSLIEIPTIIAAAGNSPKRITEHVERDGLTRLLRRPRTTRYATRRGGGGGSPSRSVCHPPPHGRPTEPPTKHRGGSLPPGRNFVSAATTRHKRTCDH